MTHRNKRCVPQMMLSIIITVIAKYFTSACVTSIEIVEAGIVYSEITLSTNFSEKDFSKT